MDSDMESEQQNAMLSSEEASAEETISSADVVFDEMHPWRVSNPPSHESIVHVLRNRALDGGCNLLTKFGLRRRINGNRRDCVVSTFQRRLQSVTPIMKDLKLQQKVEGHTGCVNCVAWSEDGGLLCSGSDDCLINIWRNSTDGYRLKHSIQTGHTGNIVGCKWAPGANRFIGTVARDGGIMVHDAERGRRVHSLTSYDQSVHRLIWLPQNPNVMICAVSDGTVRLFDLRVDSRRKIDKNDTSNIVVDLRAHRNSDCVEVHSVAVHPSRGHMLIAGGGDDFVRVFDLRQPVDLSSPCPRRLPCSAKLAPDRGPEQNKLLRRSKITSVAFDAIGSRVAATYTNDKVYVFDASFLIAPLGSGEAGLPTMGVYDPQQAVENWLPTPEFFGEVPDALEEEPDPTALEEEEMARIRFRRKMKQTDMFFQKNSGIDEAEGRIRHREGRTYRDRVIGQMSGNVNRRTIKDVVFYGPNSEWVAIGSDCGNIFFWDSHTGKLELVLPEADQRTTNCIAPNPHDHYTIATSGIDHQVKIWSPSGRDAQVKDEEWVDDLLEENAKKIKEPISNSAGHLLLLMLKFKMQQKLANRGKNDNTPGKAAGTGDDSSSDCDDDEDIAV
eukprot:gene19340-7_t